MPSSVEEEESIAPQESVSSELHVPAPEVKQAMPAKPQSVLRKESPTAAKELLPGITPALAPRMKAEAVTKSMEKNALSPGQWLKAIDELIKEGKLDEAKNSIEKFQKRYPDYPMEKRFLGIISASGED